MFSMYSQGQGAAAGGPGRGPDQPHLWGAGEATVPSHLQDLPGDSPYRDTLDTLVRCEAEIEGKCQSTLTDSRLAELKNCETLADQFKSGKA